MQPTRKLTRGEEPGLAWPLVSSVLGKCCRGGGSEVQGHLLLSQHGLNKTLSQSNQASKLTTNFSKIVKGKGEIRKPVAFPVPST